MKNLIMCFLVFLTFGCASRQTIADERYEELDSIFAQLKGSSREQVIMNFGAPDSIIKAGSMVIYKYKTSLGMQVSNNNAVNWWTGQYMGTVSSNAWEAYDAFEVYFKQGRVVDYKIQVQR
jgi:hypothetical protein